MSKRELTIDSVYKKLSKTEIDFETLNSRDRTSVLETLEDFFNERPEAVIIRNKYYDILTNKFYVNVVTDDSNYFDGECDLISFESFDDFYKYLNGSIYGKSCYFGYKFSKEEIQKYKINKSRVNKKSLFQKNIDDYSFETLIKNYENQYKNKERFYKSINRSLDKINDFNSYKELDKSFKKFQKKFENLEDDFSGKMSSVNIFFSYLVQKNDEDLNKIILDYFCNVESLLLFEDILFYFGKDGAEYVIDNYGRNYSKSTRRKRIKIFKDKLKNYQYFDKNLRNNFKSLNDNEDDFNVNEVEIDDAIFSSNNKYDDYKINKYFKNNHFYVEQEWYLNNKIILKNKMCFEYIFDFIYFLKGDLSNADLLMCDNISNLKHIENIIFSDVKIRSKDALELGLKINEISNEFANLKQNELVIKNELETKKEFELTRIDYEDFNDKISYISDIHFGFKFANYDCKTIEDKEYIIRKISNTLIKESSFANLFAGDYDLNLDEWKLFISNLSCSNNDFFFVLGNHDLILNYEKLVNEYKKLFSLNKKNNVHLINNNIFYYFNSQWLEITEDELESIDEEELKSKLRESRLTIFGGPGFPNETNLENGMFPIVPEIQIEQNSKFLKLYNKVTETLKNNNLIVLTHLPLRMWETNIHTKPGVIYVNGHTHRNYYFDNRKKRIYADNQIGYRRNDVHFKNFPINLTYNYFNLYKDGIYEITRKEYEKFYRGLNLPLDINREFTNIYMLKRNEVYMFLGKIVDKLYVLDGGTIKKARRKDLNYYYDCMLNYSSSIKMFISSYEEIQINISNQIKRIGGSGRIHGCIIDIDFFNHLYLDPFSGKLTPYYALSIKEKYVYDNLLSLLKNQCNAIYCNYRKLINDENNNGLTILNDKLKITSKTTLVEDTSIYKVSKIIKSFQYITQNNIIRNWNDNVVNAPSIENGRLLIESIVDPEKYPLPKLNNNNNDPNKEYVIKYGGYDKIDWAEVYKDKISKQTSTIEVLNYQNLKTKATYKCKLCNHIWSVKPDYFKERQQFKCPNCKK